MASIQRKLRCRLYIVFFVMVTGLLPLAAEESSALSQQAVQLFLEGRLSEAERSAQESVRSSDDGLALALQSRIFAYKKNMQESRSKALDAIRKAPENGVALGLTLPAFSFGWDSGGLPYTRESREHAEKTLQLLPNSSTGSESYSRGLALFTLGRHEEALAEAQRGARIAPELATLHRQVGNFSENLKRYGEAEQAYKQALSVNPRFAAVKAELGSLYLDKVKDSERAQVEFREALQIDPNDVEALFAMGEFSLRQSKAQEAVRYFDNALALNPKYGKAYYYRALAYQKLGSSDKAVSDLKAYEYLAPADKRAAAFELAGDIRFAESKWSDAIDLYNSAEKYAPEKSSHLLNRAQARIENKQIDAALIDLRRSAAARPEQWETFFYIGWILSEKHDFDGAIEAYGKSIDLKPNMSGPYRNRGALYIQEKNRFDLAEADFDRAVGANPAGVLTGLYRADLYEVTGRADLAKSELKRIEKLPEYQKYKDRVRTLFPAAPFDVEAAKEALAPGTSSIQGNAASRTGLFSKVKASDVKVVLYPVTPYFQAWYDLRSKKENKKTDVLMTSAARHCFLTAETDAKGEFFFRDLKPGRYFAQTIFSYTETSVEKVVVGEGYDEEYDEYYDVYENRDFYTNHTDRLEGFVTIDRDGQAAKLSMRQNNL